MAEQKNVRCAIYTRKSTDEGLDKEFNTLEAQREAGENYVRSQKHQGWVIIPERYDDGGFSGGNINRPALKKLMSDVEDGKVDMIVVYKIDRLTRSLADFSKLIEVLDKHKCSFVSVTQNFNTYDSMGRLTLNVLLSFAQFEREVGAERIRDKVAASRKKGMWMGGNVPLGYDVVNKKLIVNPKEAKIVQAIFDKYCRCKSERDVCTYINDLGYQTKERTQRNGKVIKAIPFTHSKINYILRNPIYIGKVVHKGTTYDGLQDAIITEEQWNKVQKIKSINRDGRFTPSKVVHNSLLQGLLECGCGCNSSMIPTRTCKKNKTYEYYVSLKAVKEGYAHSLADKMSAICDKKTPIKFQINKNKDWNRFQTNIKNGTGVFLISSHLGNIEAFCAFSSPNKNIKPKKLHALMEVSQNSIFHKFIEDRNNNSSFSLYPTEQMDFQTIMSLYENLCNGDMILMAGDRVSAENSEKTIAGKLLDRNCLFPEGTFLFSKKMKHPTYAIVLPYIGNNTYKICVKEIDTSKNIENIVKQYAKFIEKNLVKYPSQWYNFYSFFK